MIRVTRWQYPGEDNFSLRSQCPQHDTLLIITHSTSEDLKIFQRWSTIMYESYDIGIHVIKAATPSNTCTKDIHAFP